jgi:hypothetical protein
MKNILTLILSISFVCITSGQEKHENFEKFLYKFSTDSIYQISRIKFPLEYKTWKLKRDYLGEIETKLIKQEDWKHDYMFMTESYRPQIFDNFEGILKDTNERLFCWFGIETGLNIKFFFKRIDGKWYLIKKEDLGD